MKRSKFIISLIIALVALVGILQGSLLLAKSPTTSRAATPDGYEWEKISTNTIRMSAWDEANYTVPLKFQSQNVYVKIDFKMVEYSSIITRSIILPCPVGIDADAFEGVGLFMCYWRSSGTGQWFDLFTDAGTAPYNPNSPQVYVDITAVWMSFPPVIIPPDGPTVNVRFLNVSNTVLNTVEVEEGKIMQAAQIPAYNAFIPPLYRLAGWRTDSGLWAHETVITGPLDFYPILEKNFDYEDVNKNVEVFYGSGAARIEYNNSTLERDFAGGVYREPTDASIQFLADPLVITEFTIMDMEIPWGNNQQYFNLQLLPSRTNDLIPSSTQHNESLKLLRLYSTDGGTVRLSYGGKTIKSIPLSDIVVEPPKYLGDAKKWEHNKISFYLSVEKGQIKYVLNSGRTGKTVMEGYLGDAYQYDLNDTVFSLGLTGVGIIRNTSITFSHMDSIIPGVLAIPKSVTYIFDKFPNIDIKGLRANTQSLVDCYVDGQAAFKTYLFNNKWQEVETPGNLKREEQTLRWYLDSAFTREYLTSYTARDLTNATLYGKWVTAEYYVTLEYFTVERFFVTGNNQGRYYDALVKKTIMKKYQRGSVINLNDFGSNIGQFKFYDYIQLIPFQGWDTNITAPVMDRMTIRGQYKLPIATLRYFDVDDNLFGDVKKEMIAYPIDILLSQFNTETNKNENWFHEPIPDDGFVGGIYRFLENIMRSLFGSDGVISGANPEALKKQQEDSAKIIKQLADKHNKPQGSLNETNEYYLLVVQAEVNLENLNQGAHGSAAFKVLPSKNKQWGALSGNPEFSTTISYWAEVHGMYSLSSSDFTMVINFERKMDGFDAFAKRTSDLAGWFGNFFGGIFGNFFGGLFKGGLGWLYTLATIVIIIILGWYLLRPLLIALCILLANLLIGLLNKIGGTT